MRPAIFDFGKNSRNFVHDWGICLKFCESVQNSTINWISWLKLPSNQNSTWRRPPFWISLKCHFYIVGIGRLASNLVCRCRMTPCYRMRGHNHHGSNFVCRYKITHTIRPIISRYQTNPSNHTSRWQPPFWIWKMAITSSEKWRTSYQKIMY